MSNVTEEEVHAAADAIDREGTKVGPRPVHAVLGRGSFSTISRYLETWVPKEPPAVAEPCPQAIVDMMGRTAHQVWASAFAAAMAAVGEDKPKLQQEIDALKEQLRDLEADNRAAVDEAVTLIADVERLTSQNTMLVEQVANLDGQLRGLREAITMKRKPGPKPKNIAATPAQPSDAGPPEVTADA